MEKNACLNYGYDTKIRGKSGLNVLFFKYLQNSNLLALPSNKLYEVLLKIKSYKNLMLLMIQFIKQ